MLNIVYDSVEFRINNQIVGTVNSGECVVGLLDKLKVSRLNKQCYVDASDLINLLHSLNDDLFNVGMVCGAVKQSCIKQVGCIIKS